jgi:uncharacterized protein GlcG (DUF336 family)
VIKILNKIVAATCLVMLHATAHAQTLQPVLTYDNAAKVRDGCLAFAKSKKLELAIAVHDEAGRLLTFARMDGASTAVSDIALWKSRSAATFRYSTAETARWNAPTLPGISTAPGGVTIFTIAGQALGGIGVSGAASEDDIACAEAGIQAANFRTSGP